MAIFCVPSHSKGLLRLQQIYQGLNPGNETFQVEIVKRINNASEAIDFLRKIESLNRWSRKFVVLDCPTDMAKEIVINHVRDVNLGKRTYHYLLSGLVRIHLPKRKNGENAKWLIHYRAFIEAAVLRSDTYESLKLSPALFRVQA